MKNELYSLNKYGHIELKIKDIMDCRGISRNALARRLDTRFEVVNKWYSGKVEKIDADILARMCFILDCKPADIIVYVKE